jgi:predicted ester cyclase
LIFTATSWNLERPNRAYDCRIVVSKEEKMQTVATTETKQHAKQLIEDYLEALSGKPKPDGLLDRYLNDDGLKEHIRVAEASFPLYEFIPHQIVAEGDLVAVRATFVGVHRGEFAGIPPTGKRVSSDLMIFYRVRDGLIVEHWLQMDMKDIVEQLSR